MPLTLLFYLHFRNGRRSSKVYGPEFLGFIAMCMLTHSPFWQLAEASKRRQPHDRSAYVR